MGSTGMYVCALAQTMPVDAEDVVLQEEAGVDCAFLQTVKHIMIWGIWSNPDCPFCFPV